MAQISVSISTSDGSNFNCSLFRESLLSIHLETLIPSGGGTMVYDKSLVQVHGMLADLQLLADRIVAAVYPDKCQADPDAQIDAEREDSAWQPGQGDVEVPNAR